MIKRTAKRRIQIWKSLLSACTQTHTQTVILNSLLAFYSKTVSTKLLSIVNLNCIYIYIVFRYLKSGISHPRFTLQRKSVHSHLHTKWNIHTNMSNFPATSLCLNRTNNTLSFTMCGDWTPKNRQVFYLCIPIKYSPWNTIYI